MKHFLSIVFAASLLAPATRAEVYELRTYTAAEGRLQDVVARFRNHTTKLIAKHGMKNIGYWVPQDAPRSQNTLIYIVAHKDREAAKKSWDAFRKDPDWIKARTASEANGKIVLKTESVFMDPADFSALK
jgi:hypothetical protein